MDKKEIINLLEAIGYLELSVDAMKKANGFDQLASGYDAETYEETIRKIVNAINDYIIVA